MARRKKKKKNNFKLIISILIILIGLYIFYITRPEYILKKKGYEAATVSLIIQMDDKIVDSALKVDKKDYIYTLINDKNYDYRNILDYVVYYEDNNNNIKINDVVNIVNNEQQEALNVTKFAKDPYFIYERLTRYLDYYSIHNDVTVNEVIKIVNTNTDYDFYTNTQSVDMTKNTLVLVNKYYKLDSFYVPGDLVDISSVYGNGQLQADAYQHFVMMNDAMKLDGLSIYISSGYRNYERQLNIYTSYVNGWGQEYADTFSAKAGYSEHQTGLAMDVRSATTDIGTFKTTEEFKWMKENAHLYGFILRYPENKEALTGYSYEPWHYRYVGDTIAKYIYENNITFDEYYAYEIGR